MQELIISVSGLRGIIGENLTPDVAVRYVAAFLAGMTPPGKIVLARDGRVSGPMLSRAIASAIQASGLDVCDIDVAATPTVGVVVRDQRALAGIQISASHNPPPYNGIKLFGADGRVLPAAAGLTVRERFLAHQSRYVDVDQLGKYSPLSDSLSGHLQRVLNTVNRDRIRKRRFRVVLDSNHGAGSLLGATLLQELGCQLDVLGGDPDGRFAHPPEPTATNLQSIAERSRVLGADVVFCQDPDADRLAIIDEQGVYIGEEYTLALTLDHILSQSNVAGKFVVTNCSTSRMAADLAEKYGARISMSAVGEANVTDRMLELKAIYGGEGNGGPIDPRVGFVRDSFAAMAQVLDLMAAREKSVSQLVAALPRYEIHKTTVALQRELISQLFDGLRAEYPEAQVDTQDGLRLDWKDRWLLVRPSNTEPIVRAIAEARQLSDAKALCQRTAELASELNGSPMA